MDDINPRDTYKMMRIIQLTRVKENLYETLRGFPWNVNLRVLRKFRTNFAYYYAAVIHS